MKYLSTRDASLRFDASQAVVQGLSREGGLFMPERFPALPAGLLEKLVNADYQTRAVEIMKLFLEEFTEEELRYFASRAYAFGEKFDTKAVAPVHHLMEGTEILELWHGPTCAFKDMALQMLPWLLTASLRKTGEDKTACILVATSGDTGKAALEGFRDVDRTKILVFYPKDGVSDIQELQMVTQQGNNVDVCSVIGNFDDAQTGVKEIFSDEKLREELAEKGYFLSSARIVMGDRINFCVPTGNFGNILAGFYAWTMGLPVNRMICASNANNVLTDFICTGVYDRNRPFYTTASPSMDILISSNLERLLYQLSGSDAEIRGYMQALRETGRYEVSDSLKEKIRARFSAGWCTDEEAAETIAKVFGCEGYLMDTHTAVAYTVLERYRKDTGDNTPSVVLSTASPYKFCASVLEALGVSEFRSGTGIIGQLEEKSRTEAPLPLKSLADKQVRFDRVEEKSAMTEVVREFLA